MSYKIVVDSCCDLPEYLEKDEHIVKIPLTIHLEGVDIVDDETFDQKACIDAIAKSPESPKTSCPSPGAYQEAYEGESKDVYVVTLSEQLSGSYNSAVVGMNLFYEEHGRTKNIHVFNSCSACCGEAQLARKIKELAEAGEKFEEVVAAVEDYRYEMDTYFVIETLETLRKNGRLSNLQAIIANVLNIKPVMGATKEGQICKLDQARGMDRALNKMIDFVIKKTIDS